MMVADNNVFLLIQELLMMDFYKNQGWNTYHQSWAFKFSYVRFGERSVP